MRIALLQMAARPGDVAANMAAIAAAAEEARAAGADLLIAPELATTGYGAGEAIRALTETHTAAQIAELAAIAQAQDLAVVAGIAERDGERLYNSAVLVAGGAAPVIYRKSHLYGDYEHALFTPGDPAAVIAEWCGVRIGLLVCYDVEFPENVRRLALAGADLIAVPTALPLGPYVDVTAGPMIQVRAFENQIFVAYANHVGHDEGFAYAGRSHVAAPDGRSLAVASGEAAGLIFADIRPADYAASRARNPYLTDLRT